MYWSPLISADVFIKFRKPCGVEDASPPKRPRMDPFTLTSLETGLSGEGDEAEEVGVRRGLAPLKEGENKGEKEKKGGTVLEGW